MSDPEQIEKDLREYLAKEPNLTRQDRLAYLQTIFHKHLEINKLEHIIPYKDLFAIFSNARTHYTKTRLPINISRKAIDPNEAVHISVMESFILYLNSMKLLKKLVKFDYQD